MANWAFVGAGHICIKTAREMITTKSEHPVGVWNRTKEKAEEFAKEIHCKVYESMDELLSDDNVDIVYIGLTNDQHYEYCLKCIAAKKAFLCEKPFTGNARETKEIIEKVKENNLFAAEAMWTWHNKPAQRVRNLVKSGQLGTIKSAKYVFLPDFGDFMRINRLVELKYYGGGLLDLGVYCIRYVYEVFGKPKSIKASGELLNGIDKHLNVVFDYDGFHVEIETGIDGKDEELFHVEGELGTVDVPNAHRGYLVKSVINGKEEVFEDNSYKYANMFVSVAQSYASGEKESILSLQSTLDIMEIMDEIRRQVGVTYACD